MKATNLYIKLIKDEWPYMFVWGPLIVGTTVLLFWCSYHLHFMG